MAAQRHVTFKGREEAAIRDLRFQWEAQVRGHGLHIMKSMARLMKFISLASSIHSEL